MSVAGLSSDEADALKELANVGMGRSAFALNRLLSIEVGLSIPELYALPVARLGSLLGHPDVVVMRQAFTDAFEGEVLTLFDANSRSALAPLADDGSHDELMLEVANILGAAFLGTVAEQLQHTVSFLPPSFLNNPQQPELLVQLHEMRWKQALVVEVAMHVGEQTAVCKMLLVFPDSALEAVHTALSRALGA